MNVNPIEFLEVRDKVQINATALDAATAATIGPWADSSCKQGLYYVWADSECYFKQESASISQAVTLEF